jgi:hypothetical protein
MDRFCAYSSARWIDFEALIRYSRRCKTVSQLGSGRLLCPNRSKGNDSKFQPIQSGDKSMRNKRIFTILTVIGLLAALTMTVYATTSAHPATPSLVGTWKMTLPKTATSPELSESLQTFFADGNFIESINNLSIASTAHGVWIGSGNTYLNTFQTFTYDAQGKYNGKRTIHSSIKMDSADHYTAHFVTDSIDLAGKVTKNIFSGTLEATRMEPELP